ncbi:2-amino-3-carboxymuconate-6-semialdehyde decarboxylase [Staphylococcus condimenti]|uniref:amidohydrolase family protein n=1 Tax=Staphylococcus TaxID=1279 RepID=UPI0008A31D11|nr:MULTISPECIES: amidohydrolase family protein [Staphylococcus]APR61554.1 2-amino-3-carboxymuconate-6-semialdehyde decarboxylase [Staphylococcus condimenti]MDK8645358.1 amidohydrolase family protein [Staphylococcus condimenti]OFO98810.1 2-amino-3-carboxymuconate-6-semialdehyde decarboxylase [Staphylococcus sp. HMSC065E08]
MTKGIIDVHHHIIPDVYKSALVKNGVDKAGGMPIKDWTPEDSIAYMDRLGIEVGIGSISDPGLNPLDKEARKQTAREINDFEANMIQEYPNRFGGFATLPLPEVEDSIQELKYALDELKLDGVGLLSNYNEHFLGDPIFEDVMKELDKRNAVVFIHPSAAQADQQRPYYCQIDFLLKFTFNTTRAAANLVLSGTMDRYPNIKFILGHAGGTLPYLRWRIDQSYSWMIENLEDAVKLSKRPAEYISDFYYETALSTQPATFEALEETTDESHLLFGSDAHYAPETQAAKMIEIIENYHKFSESEIAAIERKNALELFPRFK